MLNKHIIDYHIVQKGETLHSIAADRYGFGFLWRLIYYLNKDMIGDNPDHIFPGMYIRVI